MLTTLELRVLVLTLDQRPDAAASAESNVARVLADYYPHGCVYVEHVDSQRPESRR